MRYSKEGARIHFEIDDVAVAFLEAGVAQQDIQGPSSREPGGAGAGPSGITTPTKVLDRQKSASPDSLILGRVSRLSNQFLLMALIPPAVAFAVGTNSQIWTSDTGRGSRFRGTRPSSGGVRQSRKGSELEDPPRRWHDSRSRSRSQVRTMRPFLPGG